VQLWTKINWLDFEIKKSKVKVIKYGQKSLVENAQVFPAKAYRSTVCRRRPLTLLFIFNYNL